MSTHPFKKPNYIPCHYLKLLYLMNLKIKDLILNIIFYFSHALMPISKTICIFKDFIYLLTDPVKTNIMYNLYPNFTTYLYRKT